jgi:hypothetical protein
MGIKAGEQLVSSDRNINTKSFLSETKQSIDEKLSFLGEASNLGRSDREMGDEFLLLSCETQDSPKKKKPTPHLVILRPSHSRITNLFSGII